MSKQWSVTGVSNRNEITESLAVGINKRCDYNPVMHYCPGLLTDFHTPEPALLVWVWFVEGGAGFCLIIIIQMFGSFSALITNTEFIHHLEQRNSFWYQLWHIDVVCRISLGFYLFVIHKAVCVVHSAAHSPAGTWIIILRVNYDKDFLYIHPAWKQYASTNMSAPIKRCSALSINHSIFTGMVLAVEKWDFLHP